MTYFIHVRRMGPDGRPLLHGGATVAYNLSGALVRFYVALCGKNDRYNKKIGRAVAGGRLAKGHLTGSFVLPTPCDQPHVLVRERILGGE